MLRRNQPHGTGYYLAKQHWERATISHVSILRSLQLVLKMDRDSMLALAATVRTRWVTRKEDTFTVQQQTYRKDPGPRSNTWVSKVSMPSPSEDDIRQALFHVIEKLGDGSETWTRPSAIPVPGEWVGRRKSTDDKPGNLTEAQTYDLLVKDSDSPLTILYVHGGAFW